MSDAYICVKHGEYNVPMQFTAIECPQCRSERITPCSTPPTLSPEQSAEKAVVRAAEEHRRALSGLYSLSDSELRLCDAVDALRATKQPQPVRPEEVPIGTRFLCTPYADGKADGNTYRLVGYCAGGETRFAVNEATWETFVLCDEDRIIPIPTAAEE